MKRVIIAAITLVCSLTLHGQRLQVDFITPTIVRVQWSHNDALHDNETGVCVYPEPKVSVERQEDERSIELFSSKLHVQIDKATNAVSFFDRSTGELLLCEDAKRPHESEPVYQERVIYDENTAQSVETANGKVTVREELRRDTLGQSTRYRVHFQSEGERALYGLGCQMEDYMNLLGKTLYLTQHNLKVHVPMLCSTKGYGLLFNAGCAMKFTSQPHNLKTSQPHNLTLELEAAKELDYYFIRGEHLDNVIAQYRYLTGQASLMPRYLFGYTQSKERYCSSDEIVSVLRQYREQHIPIDMIVQDWNYWPQGWGYMKMDPRYYPSPRALADSVHALNAKLMVSIWPNPQWCPEAEDFKARGMMLNHDVYDVFSPEARQHYWSYADGEFFSQGFDAWWCDSSEPLDGDWNKIPQFGADGTTPYGWDEHEMRWHLNQDILSEAMGAERSSLYSLYHSMGIYDNQRASTQDKRVVNLTRSSYAGQQRYGTVVWNGDTHASWQSFRQQIPAGLNYMATGNPYWTVDVGSFFTRDDGRRWFYRGEFPEGVNDDAYKEYYLRMFQWATFLPMLRSHGSDTPREVWQFRTEAERAAGTDLSQCQYAGELLRLIQLRYRLIPYIYSMAARQTFKGYTMARLLAFDFAADTTVLDIKDEYMFGDFLVCPVTHPLSEATSRPVYLPQGSKWIDYHTQQLYRGGQWIDYPMAHAGQFPLFVRAGSIIATTEVAEWSDAQRDLPITFDIYPGDDAVFTLYEDEGDNYNYEQGQRSNIVLCWTDKQRCLTIGSRQGSYPGMPQQRTFIVHTPMGDQQVTYTGQAITLSFQ